MFDLLVALCLFNEIACEQQKIINYAVRSAELHQIDSNKFLELISCESRFIKNAKGDYRIEEDRYMANGILQFWQGTFNEQAKKYGINGKYTDPYSQIDIATRIIAGGGWRHWQNCMKAIGWKNSEHLLARKNNANIKLGLYSTRWGP